MLALDEKLMGHQVYYSSSRGESECLYPILCQSIQRAVKIFHSQPQMSTPWWNQRKSQGNTKVSKSSGHHQCLHRISRQSVPSSRRDISVRSTKRPTNRPTSPSTWPCCQRGEEIHPGQKVKSGTVLASCYQNTQDIYHNHDHNHRISTVTQTHGAHLSHLGYLSFQMPNVIKSVAS